MRSNHLLGVVRQADVDAVLGPPRHRFLPNGFLGWTARRNRRFGRTKPEPLWKLFATVGVGFGRLLLRSDRRGPYEPAELTMRADRLTGGVDCLAARRVLR